MEFLDQPSDYYLLNNFDDLLCQQRFFDINMNMKYTKSCFTTDSHIWWSTLHNIGLLKLNVDTGLLHKMSWGKVSYEIDYELDNWS
jgi:hypothetical protein